MWRGSPLPPFRHIIVIGKPTYIIYVISDCTIKYIENIIISYYFVLKYIINSYCFAANLKKKRNRILFHLTWLILSALHSVSFVLRSCVYIYFFNFTHNRGQIKNVKYIIQKLWNIMNIIILNLSIHRYTGINLCIMVVCCYLKVVFNYFTKIWNIHAKNLFYLLLSCLNENK